MKTLKALALPILLSVAALLGSATPAAARPAHCVITMNGYTYMNGTCNFVSGRGGSFQISNGNYFAEVNPLGDGTALGYIGEDRAGPRVMSEMGQLARDGACWTNDYASVCAWSL